MQRVLDAMVILSLRVVVVAFASIVTFFALADRAHASVAWVSDGATVLRYEAWGGEANDVTMRFSENVAVDGRYLIVIADTGAFIEPGEDCWSITATGEETHVSTRQVECYLRGPDEVAVVALGDLDDRFIQDLPNVPTRVSAGTGEDVVIGGSDQDFLCGRAEGDVLLGRGGDDTLVGGDGSDTLDGGPGADVFDGGLGADIADYSTRTSRVDVAVDGAPSVPDRDALFGPCEWLMFETSARSSVPVFSSAGRFLTHVPADDGEAGEGDDVLNNVEVVIGGSADDALVGNALRNVLYGNGGNDTLRGLSGPDLLDGGAGLRDVARYDERGLPVAVSLDGVANDGTAGEGDNVASSVEEVFGGAGNDTLIGGVHANWLHGQAGDDTIAGGEGTVPCPPGSICVTYPVRSDLLDGGLGVDTADYSARHEDVTIMLDSPYSGGAAGEEDSVIGMENAIGGSGNDSIFGNGLANTLTGGQGSDRLEGMAGPDTIISNDFIAITGLRFAWPDSIFCGSEPDTVHADYADSVAGDCETLTR